MSALGRAGCGAGRGRRHGGIDGVRRRCGRHRRHGGRQRQKIGAGVNVLALARRNRRLARECGDEAGYRIRPGRRALRSVKSGRLSDPALLAGLRPRYAPGQAHHPIGVDDLRIGDELEADMKPREHFVELPLIGDKLVEEPEGLRSHLGLGAGDDHQMRRRRFGVVNASPGRRRSGRIEVCPYDRRSENVFLAAALVIAALVDSAREHVVAAQARREVDIDAGPIIDAAREAHGFGAALGRVREVLCPGDRATIRTGMKPVPSKRAKAESRNCLVAPGVGGGASLCMTVRRLAETRETTPNPRRDRTCVRRSE